MTSRIGGLCIVAAIGAIAASCAHERPKTELGPPPPLPDAKRGAHVAPPPEWYWEPVDARVRDTGAPKIERPTPDASIVRLEAATRLWDDLGDDGRDRLRQSGVVAIGSELPPKERAIGAFYQNLREERFPYVVTLEALFFAARVAIVRAVAEVESNRIAPALTALLASLTTRLGAEQRGASIEVAEGLRVARGLVAVATVLADRKMKIDADLAPVVLQELARIDAHAGVDKSPLLGASIDYAALAVPPDLANPGAYRALAWLGAAPLALVAGFEASGATLDLSTIRRQTRAAMLLARLVDRDVDAQNHESYTRIAKMLAFVWGAPDDVSLALLGELAPPLGVTFANAEHVANVTKVDRVRRRAAEVRAPTVFDGSGSPGRAGASVRVFGGSAPPDSRLLAGLTGAPVGRSPDGALRMLASTLDIAVWLGAPEARVALHESGGDVYETYGSALARLVASRPTEDSLHGSLHGSMLAAIAAWLALRGTAAEERATMESALAAWTWLRHDGQALARRERDRPRAREPAELRVTGAALTAFVEPAPDVIARLIGAVKQAQRGFLAVGALDSGSPALTGLADVEDLLRAALRIAEHEVNDEALGADDLAALASMPARLASLEGEESVVCAAALQSDLHGKVLVGATGFLEPIARVVREPGTGRLVLAVGAHVAHGQMEVEGRIGDAAFEKRLAAAPLARGARGAWVTTFRIVH